jgi:hypothetical protein
MATPFGSLDRLLVRLSRTDVFTLSDLIEGGAHIFGATGAGKTSGSGETIAGALLRSGAGMLVLAAKPTEVDLWRRRAMKHGRANSLIIFDESQGFNFLNYSLAQQGMAGINSVVETLLHILEAARRSSPSPGAADEIFWQDSMRQALGYTLPALYAAYGTVNVNDILRFIHAAPTKVGQHEDKKFQQSNHVFLTLDRAATAPKVPLAPGMVDAMVRFWFTEFAAMPEKTRGNIIASISAALGRFRQGRLNTAFCQRTTIVPDFCFNGAIIVMAMPALTWGADGIIAQQLFKYMWQRSIESRNALPPQFHERPVVLWADEAQYFVNSYDGEFLSTCREARAGVVFLSQNLPTYYAKMGKGEEAAAHALIGKFNTHIFHANACPRTNEFAASLIGRALHQRSTYSYGAGSSRNSGMNAGSSTSWGSSTGSGGSLGHGQSSHSWNAGSNRGGGDSWGDNRAVGTSENTSHGYTEAMDHLIEPSWFSYGLKTGGRENGREVTAIWFKNSAGFKAGEGRNFLHVSFKQEGRP